jgi:predicted alpha/beta hydrolase
VRFVQFDTSDGVTLNGTLYESEGDEAIVVAGAMAAPRRYYDRFAEYAAARGFTTLVFDYRGMEGSPRRSRARLQEWGEFDIAAAIGFMSSKRISLVCHSVGGQVAGLADNISSARKIVLVASQSGYWRHWSGIRRPGLHLLWHLMPAISRILGYFPAPLLGLGPMNLPRGVAMQWSQWGRHPRYLFGAAVDALVREYSNARVERRHFENASVGHFGAFRRGSGEALWEEIINWLR